jgi:malonate-semialdehyde dehydrogenase (acetylating)/methylmalonate-semialdehyde dehydrogenase
MNQVSFPPEVLPCPHLIGGSWLTGVGELEQVISPLNGKVIGNFNHASEKDVDNVISKAHEAFPAWKETPLKERCQIMFRFRLKLLEEIDNISNMVSLESGKTLAEAKAGVMKGIEVLEFALSLQNLDKAAKMEVSRGVTCEYRREPLGVVASITPFNFPAMVPMWTIPIALTLGNCYIWKPSEKTPLTSILIANALKDAGLPDGVLSIIHGSKNTVEQILEDHRVKAISFVGSTPVAKAVYKKGTSHGKRVLALGGAKNHIFLMPDADIAIAAPGISDSFTGCAGQRCMAASVLLTVGNVEKHIYEIVERASQTRLGQTMGAIITKTQLDFLNEMIEKAEAEGSTIVLDGRKAKAPEGLESGYWLGPTIINGLNPNSDLVKTELFGPILTIINCSSLSQAMNIENQSNFGNAASVFTKDGAIAEWVSKNAKAGMIGVNIGVPVPREPFSFGGQYDSKFGHGDITGEPSLNFWSDLKKVTMKWKTEIDNNWMS